jgi:hypothetical protein
VVLADPVVQAALVAQVVLAVLVVPVALANPAVQVVPENPAGAARVLVQVAPPAKIKWVTAAHHHGQVRVPTRVEALAVVAAATMHAPAATEAATVWVAAE